MSPSMLVMASCRICFCRAAAEVEVRFIHDAKNEGVHEWAHFADLFGEFLVVNSLKHEMKKGGDEERRSQLSYTQHNQQC